jgi:hypothetical protein
MHDSGGGGSMSVGEAAENTVGAPSTAREQQAVPLNARVSVAWFDAEAVLSRGKL